METWRKNFSYKLEMQCNDFLTWTLSSEHKFFPTHLAPCCPVCMLSFSPQFGLLLSFCVVCALVGSADGCLCYTIYGAVFMLLKHHQMYCAEASDGSGEVYSNFP